jgi:hypothetical protein
MVVTIESCKEGAKVTMGGQSKIIKGVNALKLARTLFNKKGTKYTSAQMEKWGFELK